MKLLLLAALAAIAAFPQAASDANQGYRTAKDRERVAKTLDAPDRDSRQQPEKLLQELALQPGQVVADIGTGAGYLLPHLSKAVGPSGAVVAEDIFPDFLDKAKAKAAAAKLTNVRFVLGDEKSAKLAPASVDVAFTLDAYHHYDYPREMLASIHEGLKSGGRFVVVDYHRNQTAMPNGRAMTHIRAGRDEVVREIEAAGFRLTAKREHIENVQYLIEFVKR